MDPVLAELERLRQAPTAFAIERALALHRAGVGATAAAQALLGEVLLRADAIATLRLAHDLLVAAMAEHRPARRLAAEAFDRLRVCAGQTQKFGTQRRADGSPYPIDATTTDSERAKWDLPTRAELETRPGGGAGA